MLQIPRILKYWYVHFYRNVEKSIDKTKLLLVDSMIGIQINRVDLSICVLFEK